MTSKLISVSAQPQFSPEPVVTCVNKAAGIDIRPQLRVLYLVEAEAAVQQQDQPLQHTRLCSASSLQVEVIPVSRPAVPGGAPASTPASSTAGCRTPRSALLLSSCTCKHAQTSIFCKHYNWALLR